MRKGTYFLVFLIGIAAICILLQKRYNIISFFEPSTIANQGKSQEYLSALWDGMMERESEIVVNFVGDSTEVKEYSVNALNQVFEIDREETSSDFDYLRYHYAGTSVTMTGFGRSFQVAYRIDYLETKEQLQQVEKEVARVLEQLQISKKSDFKKVKRIHDFIIKNAQYDTTAKRNSAYSNLIEKKSACQGYATLVYKMMTDAGIPCRIIAGKSSGEAHAWNIVKVDGKWYNLDCTWDDPVGKIDPDAVHYEFFLKSDSDFTDHQRDEEYDSREFRSQYPISLISYGA